MLCVIASSLNVDLREPLNAFAVWTDNGQFFHICWNSQDNGSPGPQPMTYNTTDSSSSNLNTISYSQTTSMYCANFTKPPASENIVFVQAFSLTALPSVPLQVNISGKASVSCTLKSPALSECSAWVLCSEPGVMLMHNNKMIENGSVLSIEVVGEGEMALICHTSRKKCCSTMRHRYGEWYYPGGSNTVPNFGSNEKFYRNRSDDGKVLLHKRPNNMQAETGIYCCVIPDRDDNCCLLYTSPSPRDATLSRMPSSA